MEVFATSMHSSCNINYSHLKLKLTIDCLSLSKVTFFWYATCICCMKLNLKSVQYYFKEEKYFFKVDQILYIHTNIFLICVFHPFTKIPRICHIAISPQCPLVLLFLLTESRLVSKDRKVGGMRPSSSGPHKQGGMATQPSSSKI